MKTLEALRRGINYARKSTLNEGYINLPTDVVEALVEVAEWEAAEYPEGAYASNIDAQYYKLPEYMKDV